MLCCSAVLLGVGCGKSSSSKPEKKQAASSRLDQLLKDLGDQADVAKEAGCTITTPRMLEATHKNAQDIADIHYSSDPPSSGPHMVDWAAWGFYDKPVKNAYVVHNLEHGGVALWYGDGVSDTHKKLIRDSVLDQDEKWIVSPLKGLDGIVTSSWGTRMECPGDALGTLPPDALQKLLDTWFQKTQSTQTEKEADIPAYAGAMSGPKPDRDISTPSPNY